MSSIRHQSRVLTIAQIGPVIEQAVGGPVVKTVSIEGSVDDTVSLMVMGVPQETLPSVCAKNRLFREVRSSSTHWYL